MDTYWSYTDLLRNAEQAASGFFETLTDTVAGKADPLRDGTEHDPVSLPRDLAAHSNVQTEWWYYTGHAVTDSGREFGFELVFFKRRTDLDKFAVVPVRLLGNPFYFAHFAITDKTGKQFRYDHRKSANRPFDIPASASESHFHLTLGDWTARLAHGSHVLRASIGASIIFEASLTPSKDVVLNGEGGVSFKDKGEASRYFSYTRMLLEGDLWLDGKIEHFTGSAWMDREFGTWAPTEYQKGWDWFSIQLDDNSELMVYRLRNSKGEPSPYSTGCFHHADGQVTRLGAEEFTIGPISKWKSLRSEGEYPSSWKIEVPELGLDLSVDPVVPDQELDTRGTTMIVYWEGACRVSGERDSKPVTGNAYVELVGYDRSHDRPDLSRFLLGNYLNYIGF
jgi:predicted secreted hydrolase